jgi:processive 1,2-diacylglycerol beta-glucosyltransferase
MKKVLIFYGSYGGGHLSAAKSIENYIKNSYPDIEIKLVDCMEYINKHLNKLLADSYNEAAKKVPWAWKKAYYLSNDGLTSKAVTTSNKLFSIKLNTLLQEFKPDLIISTHPFGTQMCGILKKKEKINCKLATILTDFHIHGQWLVFHEYCDYFFVSNEQMKHDMIEYGVSAEKIHVSGIPVSNKFKENFNKEEIMQEFDLNPNEQVVLFFAGGEFGLGNKTTILVLKSLIRLFSKLQVVAVSGKNPKMKLKLEKLVKNTDSSDRIKVLEYTNKVPELMSISSFVITKPGGLTSTESLTSHLPMVIINPIPGQEEENAEFLVEKGVAIWIKKNDNVARVFKDLYRNPQTLDLMKENTYTLAKPNSTECICKILLDK